MQLGTQHYVEYINVVNFLELRTIVICLKLRAKLRCYGFLKVFDTFSHKVVQPWFIWNETWTQHYFVYLIVLKWLELKTIVICLKLRAKLRF